MCCLFALVVFYSLFICFVGFAVDVYVCVVCCLGVEYVFGLFVFEI